MSGIENSLGMLYLKEKKLEPEFCEVRMDYGSMALQINYKLKEGELQRETVEIHEAMGFLAEKILKNSAHFTD